MSSPHYWLLSDEALQARALQELRRPGAYRAAALARDSGDGADSTVLSVADGVATIRVAGVLTPTPDPYASWDGEDNTTYPELQAALSAAVADPEVSEIMWSIDSPGGSVDGLFSLLDDIAEARAAGANMRVEADNAHSAAYGIAAAAGPITARSRMSSFGSVGVATNGFVLGKMIGEVVHLTNSDAPEKRPAIDTPEGKQVVVKYLDQIGSEFMTAIAAGRGIATDAVASGYGRGSSMLASAAKAAGMIDAIATRIRGPGQMLDRPDVVGYRATMATAPAPTPVPVAAPDPAVAELAALKASLASAFPGLDPSAAIAHAASLASADVEREATERRSLVTTLVELGAETPATAWVNGAPALRLLAEPLAELRTRVAALKSARPAPDPAGGIRPPASGAPPTGTGREPSEQEAAFLAKHPPALREKILAVRDSMRQKTTVR